MAGDGQRGPLGEALADPLVVQLVDTEGLPVEGRAVVFRFTDDVPDAAIDPASAPTDADGHAAVRARLGRRAGSQAIEALVAGAGGRPAGPVPAHGVARRMTGTMAVPRRRRRPMTEGGGGGRAVVAAVTVVGVVTDDGGGGGHGGGHGNGNGNGNGNGHGDD